MEEVKSLAFQSCHLLVWMEAKRDHLQREGNNRVRAEIAVVMSALAATILESRVPQKRSVSHLITDNGEKQRVRKIRGLHGSDYEECRLLGYKDPVRTSRETHFVSATESSQLMLCKI
jgi:hypothetical protein